MNTPNLDELREILRQGTYQDEAAIVNEVLAADVRTDAQITAAQDLAIKLIQACREQRQDRSLLDAFLDQFGLSTEEGVALMCLAESIVRVPDRATADDLIADKLSSGRWREHLGQSDSMLVNASTWALMLTGEVVDLGQPVQQNFGNWFGRLVNRMGEPVIRQSLRYAMQLLGNEFVYATTATNAVASASKGGLYSFDMLGEAARTHADADNYFQAYTDALTALEVLPTDGGCLKRSGISVKLSALYPRYDTLHEPAVHQHLYPKLLKLAQQAAALDVQLTIDAEEANRLDLSLGLIERLCAEPSISHWQGLGLAVQAYGRRCLALLDWLEALGRAHQRRLIVRLVKGAYWDSEIKLAQQQGVPGYPVFTSKPATDLNYLAAAQVLLRHPAQFYPQFATHNAHTLANVVLLAGSAEFEMQRLHGMGELLYQQATTLLPNALKLRTYAPVGPHKHLMAYLIRRLLENGANSSFVNRFLDEEVPVQRLVRNNRHLVIAQATNIVNPPDLFRPERANSDGVELHDPAHLVHTRQGLEPFEHNQYQASQSDVGTEVRNPAKADDALGNYSVATEAQISQAFTRAQSAQPQWNNTSADQRAVILERTARLIQNNHHEFMALLIREAGKSLDDAVDEIREAVDFCFYYAAQCRLHFAQPLALPGPTGEHNTLALAGRGLFICISPWNFPLAIFVGQVSAALAAGNAVLAKPAEQTTLVAKRCVELLHEAGVPGEILHLLAGDGDVGARLVADAAVAGVAFTGSTGVAKRIQQSLTTNVAEIVPLIAETGGQNCMVVDSTAMPEQVVDDVIRSAFGSAGQRCSALRVLCVQEEIADELLTMLSGAMDTLIVGDPWQTATDIGPIIDAAALTQLETYLTDNAAKVLHRTTLDSDLTNSGGHFLAPTLLEIKSINELEREQFGPVLHVRRFRREQLDLLLDEINNTGYGLTLGIHSRNNQFIDRVATTIQAGNVYVNRNMIGAVVGVQPFGGRGLSGSGPKAGGPNYLPRFAVERTLTNNIAAIGGNLDLLATDLRSET